MPRQTSALLDIDTTCLQMIDLSRYLLTAHSFDRSHVLACLPLLTEQSSVSASYPWEAQGQLHVPPA